MQQVELTIDEKPVKADTGTKILDAALAAEIYIPNLCYIPEAELPYGGCRLCYVHVEGRGLVTACTLPVQNGIKVHTQTPEVMRVRRTAYKLLIAYHNLDCRACWKNKKCDLQKLAAKVKVKLKRPEDFRGLPTEFLPPDTTTHTSPTIPFSALFAANVSGCAVSCMENRSWTLPIGEIKPG
jgi:formate dehydrogenase major subunit/NADH-quinone oxidoreductase subunit G